MKLLMSYQSRATRWFCHGREKLKILIPPKDAKQLYTQTLKSCPNCNTSPNLVTLVEPPPPMDQGPPQKQQIYPSGEILKLIRYNFRLKENNFFRAKCFINTVNLPSKDLFFNMLLSQSVSLVVLRLLCFWSSLYNDLSHCESSTRRYLLKNYNR